MDKSLKSYLEESYRVDEVLLSLLAVGLIAMAAKPALKELAGRAGEGVGSFFGGFASLFGISTEQRKRREEKRKEREERRKEREREWKEEEKERKQEEKEAEKERKQEEKEAAAERKKEEAEKKAEEKQAKADKKKEEAEDRAERMAYANVMEIARKHANGDQKKMIDLLDAAGYDKDGNMIPPSKMGERIEELTGIKTEDLLKAHGIKELTPEQEKDLQKQTQKELEKLTPEEREKIAKDGEKNAKEISATMQKYKNDMDAAQKKLVDAQKANDDMLKKAAKEEIEKIKKNAKGPAASLQGVTDKAIKNGAKPIEKETEPEKKEEPKEKTLAKGIVHNGEETTLKGRPKKNGQPGLTYNYGNDPNGQTIPKKQAQEIIRKAKKAKKGEKIAASLTAHLANVFS